jgi:hypothetical protein
VPRTRRHRALRRSASCDNLCGMKVVASVAVLALAACAHTAVQDLGSGRHALTAMSPSGGYYGSHEEAVEEANAFCARASQQAQVDGFYDKPELGPQGEHTSSIFFHCGLTTPLRF